MEAPQVLAERLSDQVAAHKAAIRSHRRGLVQAAAALEQLRRECANRGIELVIVPRKEKGEGENPWPTR